MIAFLIPLFILCILGLVPVLMVAAILLMDPDR